MLLIVWVVRTRWVEPGLQEHYYDPLTAGARRDAEHDARVLGVPARRLHFTCHGDEAAASRLLCRVDAVFHIGPPTGHVIQELWKKILGEYTTQVPEHFGVP